MSAPEQPAPAKTTTKPKYPVGPILFVSAIALVAGGLCWWLKGPEVFRHVLWEDVDLLLQTIPRILLGLVFYGLVTELVPREWVARQLGGASGLRGLLIATVAGAATPGGPWVVYPLALGFARAGADAGACITYITAWSLLGLNRLLVWEFAFLGEDIALGRWASAWIIPLAAGLVVRRFLPIATSRI